MDSRHKLGTIVVLGMLGLVVTAYQTYDFYFGLALCNYDSIFSCGLVTGSIYGSFPPGSGIATALWGIPWWISIVLLAGGMLIDRPLFTSQDVYLFGMSMLGLVMVLYLLVIELIVLPAQNHQLAICPFCTVQHILVVIITVLSSLLMDRSLELRARITGSTS